MKIFWGRVKSLLITSISALDPLVLNYFRRKGESLGNKGFGISRTPPELPHSFTLAKYTFHFEFECGISRTGIFRTSIPSI